MKYNTLLKSAVSFFLTLSTAALVHPQSVDVRLNPDVEAPAIGQLESSALAVDAQWPEGQEPVKDWKPIFYRGTFEVFVSNNDISKDLTPKPGCSYLLSPKRDGVVLSTATKEDKTDLISVDPRFSKLNIETILVAYIQDIVQDVEEATPTPETPSDMTTETDSAPEPIASQPPAANSTATMQEVEATAPANIETPSEENPIRRLLGVLQKTTLLEKSKTDCAYKLIDTNGKTLGFLDTQKLPTYLIIKDYIGNRVSVNGHLYTIESSNNLKIVAASLKKAN